MFLRPKDVTETSVFSKERPFKGGGSGLILSTSDYARFLQMISNGGIFEGHCYLKKETVDLMRTNPLSESIPCLSFGKSQRFGTSFGWGFAVSVASDDR